MQKPIIPVAFYIGAFFFAVFALFHGGHFYHADEELHFLVANSLLDGNGGAVAPVQEAYYRGQYAGINDFRTMGKMGLGGRFYAKSGLGQPLAVLPLVGLARFVTSWFPGSNPPALQRLIVSFFCPIVASIGLALCFMLIENLGYRRITAFAVVCMIGFGTFYFVQAKFFMNHMLVSTLLILGLLSVQRASEESFGRLLLGGFCAGLVIFTRIDCFCYAALVPVYWLLKNRDIRRRRLRALLLIGLGASGPLLLLGVWNLLRFGNLIDLGYNISDPTQPSYDPFNQRFLTGFAGQILNLQTGLLWFAPPILVSFSGLMNLARRHSYLAWTAALGLLFPLAFYAKLGNWAGEISWGPRFLLPSIPLIGLGLAPVLQDCRLGKSSRRGLINVVFALGVLVQMFGLIADHNRGNYQTRRKIEYNPRYAKIPYMRVLSQLEVLKERSPDIWWISSWTQGSSMERVATCFGVSSLVALLAPAIMALKKVLEEDAHLAKLGAGSQ